MPPSTVDGKILLGWMGRDEALRVLLQEAVFDDPLDEAGAIRLWECFKAKVSGLGPRACPAPILAPQSLKEKLAGERLIKKAHRKGGFNVKRLVKLDPWGLVVHQLQVIEDRSNLYRRALRTDIDKVKMCLPSATGPHQLPFQRVQDTIIIDLPHGEYEISVNPQKNIEISENARHISIAAFDGRLLLWAGYHRSYALTLASQEYPEEIERLVLAILTTDADLFLGARSIFPDKRDMVRGPCPALFRDFFDDDLCMKIKLRKRRCQIHLNATNSQMKKIWVDDV